MPLGIELAASLMQLFSPVTIARETARTLGFLRNGQPDMPERDRSLRVVFEDSWQLLTASEQEILCRLSVLDGTFDRVTTLQTGGATLGRLATLANHSLLWRVAEDSGTSRYTIPAVARPYAASPDLKRNLDRCLPHE